jgi:transposase
VQGYSFQARLHREEFRNLHQAGRERHDLREKQSALQMQITALVQEVFPELRQAFKNLFGLTSLSLLETTPLPAQMGALGEDELTRRVHTASRGRLGRKKALQLLELARLSIGVTAANDAVVARLQRLVVQWRGLQQQLQQVEAEMATYLPDAAQPLLQIKGLSTVLVATLLGEIGDWTFFANATQLVKLAGMSPQRWASGDREKAPHLTRKGQPWLQYTVYLCALSLVKHNPAFRAYYQSLCQRGKPKMVALCAVGRKFLHVVFEMLKHGTEFDPQLVGAGLNQPTPAA